MPGAAHPPPPALQACCGAPGAHGCAPRRLPGGVAAQAEAVERDLWYPGSTPPKHLDGSLPGDYGCAGAACRLRRKARGSPQSPEP